MVRPIKTGGFVIPQQQEMHTPLLRITNPQSLNRLGHFLRRISNPASASQACVLRERLTGLLT